MTGGIIVRLSFATAAQITRDDQSAGPDGVHTEGGGKTAHISTLKGLDMSAARSTVSSLRESLSTYRANRARLANLDAIASSDLSPNARHEVMVILTHREAEETPAPVARRASVTRRTRAARRVGTRISTSV